MKRSYPVEFVYQVLSLVISVIVVHAFYVTVVWPRSEAILADQRVRMAADSTYVQERSIWVILRDYEQESEIILMLWALAIMAFKGFTAARERRLLEKELVPLPEGTKILPEDAREYARQIESLPAGDQRLLLPRSILTALHRFGATRNIQDVAATAHSVCEAESDRLDSELAMMRYIAWAIPAIGFIGTVRGIGDALGQAHRAVEGDIAGVTESLGTAFNSTLVALLISMVLMFLLHQLQFHQERLVLDTGRYLDQHVIQRLRVP
jgi:biopolymer transport protein ExbB/TolQ